MKMVVTGGAGFIGSHLVNGLVNQGYEVHVIDNLTTGDPGRLHSEAILHVADVNSQQTTAYISVLKPDVVFHLAAQADVQRSIKEPRLDADANVMGTINVLEACRKAGVRKIVFASTSGVYGDLEKSQLTEDDPVNPISFYALSKVAGEQYIRLYHRFFGLQYTILRYGNVYGPGQTAKGKAVLWRYLVTACVKVLRFIYTAMASKPGTSFMSRMLLKQTSPPFNTGTRVFYMLAPEPAIPSIHSSITSADCILTALMFTICPRRTAIFCTAA